MKKEEDPELHTFASGTRRFESSIPATLPQALNLLEKARREKPYKRTQVQMDASKRISDRIMGERDA